MYVVFFGIGVTPDLHAALRIEGDALPNRVVTVRDDHVLVDPLGVAPIVVAVAVLVAVHEHVAVRFRVAQAGMLPHNDWDAISVGRGHIPGAAAAGNNHQHRREIRVWRCVTRQGIATATVNDVSDVT